MIKADLIERMWKCYKDNIYKGCSPGPIQLKETRQAFFSGAIALFTAVIELTNDNNEAVIMVAFDKIQKEVDKFESECIEVEKLRGSHGNTSKHNKQY